MTPGSSISAMTRISPLHSALPLTHSLVLVRGIILTGNTLAEMWSALWPIGAFMLAVIAIGLRFYKRTLD